MINRQIRLIMDLQFGSTGKGLIAGFLGVRDQPDTLVTAWAANAGHTYIDRAGRKFVHTMLANGIVSPMLERIMIGPGSVLDLDNLHAEIVTARAQGLLSGVKIYVHSHAAVIHQWHRDLEAGPMTKIGSTKKGVGEAMIERIRRNPSTGDDRANIAANWIPYVHPVEQFVQVVDPTVYSHHLQRGRRIQIEGAQGHSLSMYSGFYPYTTSRDVSAAQAMADCAIPFGWADNIEVIGTARTFPIRVANRYEDGKQVGWSGPTYGDQEEITFGDLGQPQELTTVTKLPRRIFTFSHQQVADAIYHNGVKKVFLNFANYCRSQAELDGIIRSIGSSGAPVMWLGYGPNDSDVVPYYQMRELP